MLLVVGIGPQAKVRPRQLDRKVAVVTGATGGIGRAVSEALARQGCCVVASGRDRHRMAATLEACRQWAAPGDVLGVLGDVRSETTAAELAYTTLERWGRIDVLVAAAGTLRGATGRAQQLWQMSTAQWDEVLATNLTGTFLVARAVIPAMLKTGSGDIILVSSTSGRSGIAYDSAYCASKFGVIGLAESLAAEVAPKGIRVQFVLPGPVATPMWSTRDGIPRHSITVASANLGDAIAYLINLPKDTVIPMTVAVPLSYPSHKRPPSG